MDGWMERGGEGEGKRVTRATLRNTQTTTHTDTETHIDDHTLVLARLFCLRLCSTDSQTFGKEGGERGTHTHTHTQARARASSRCMPLGAHVLALCVRGMPETVLNGLTNLE
jgi:hypothetical protein